MRSVVRIKHSMERLASHGGLVHIGALLHSMQLEKRLENLENVYCVDPKFSHTDVLFSMIALISIGKSDYDAIKIFREKQDFFIKALGISGCPSSPTIRQRIDLIGNAADDILKEESAALIRSKAPVITPIKTSVGLKGEQLPFPIFFEVTERHMKKGQQLMFPDIEVDT